MDYMIIFDIVIAALGIYLMYSAFRMLKTEEVSTLLVSQEMIASCKDKKGFIENIYKKMAGFGAASVLFGILGCVDNMVYDFGRPYYIVSGMIYLAVCFWFSGEMRAQRRKYF